MPFMRYVPVAGPADLERYRVSQAGAESPSADTVVVFAHFLGDELVKQGVHPQNEIFVFIRIQRQIAGLERVILQVEELDVVVPHDFFHRCRRIEVSGRVVARELVLPVERKTHESTLVELGLKVRQRRRRFVLKQFLHSRHAIVRIDGERADVVEQGTGADGLRACGLGCGEHPGKVWPGRPCTAARR